MGSKNTSKTAERRARIAEMRRAEQARERRARILTISAIVVVVCAILVGGGLLFVASEEEQDKKNDAGDSELKPLRGEQTWDDLGRTHTRDEVDYPMDPPAGGDHNPMWINCDAAVYDEPVKNELAVHGLEHGAVWVTYTDEANEEDVESLTERVRQTPYSFISPYPDQDEPLMLTAWGHQLAIDGADDPRVAKFFERYVQGPQTPEPGAACTTG